MIEEFIYDQEYYPDGPYRRHINLWKSVITQAVKDISDDDEKVSRDAFDWIKSNDRYCFNSFLNLCTLCDVDSDKIRNILKRQSCFYCGRKFFISKLKIAGGENYCEECFNKVKGEAWKILQGSKAKMQKNI